LYVFRAPLCSHDDFLELYLLGRRIRTEHDEGHAESGCSQVPAVAI
jgi:hypothetical protein